MDKIKLIDIPFEAKHGVLPIEKEQPNNFLVDIIVKSNIKPSAATDNVSDSVDYSLLYEAANKIMSGPGKNLIETLCSEIADEILRIDNVQSVQVSVKKLNPINCGGAKYSEISIKRRR